MKDEIVRIAREVVSHRLRFPRRHFPLKLREEAIAAFDKQVSRGVSQAQAAEALGVTAKRMRRWKEKLGRMSLVQVKVSPDPPRRSRIALVSPTGWRLEGLTLNDVRQLVSFQG